MATVATIWRIKSQINWELIFEHRHKLFHLPPLIQHKFNENNVYRTKRTKGIVINRIERISNIPVFKLRYVSSEHLQIETNVHPLIGAGSYQANAQKLRNERTLIPTKTKKINNWKRNTIGKNWTQFFRAVNNIENSSGCCTDYAHVSRSSIILFPNDFFFAFLSSSFVIRTFRCLFSPLFFIPFKVSIIFDSVCSLTLVGVERSPVAVVVDWVSAKANWKRAQIKKKRKKEKLQARARANAFKPCKQLYAYSIRCSPPSAPTLTHSPSLCLTIRVGLLLRVLLLFIFFLLFFYCKLIDWLDFLACRLHRERMIFDDYWLFSCRGWIFCVVVRLVWKDLLCSFRSKWWWSQKGREPWSIDLELHSIWCGETKTVIAKKKNLSKYQLRVCERRREEKVVESGAGLWPAAALRWTMLARTAVHITNNRER